MTSIHNKKSLKLQSRAADNKAYRAMHLVCMQDAWLKLKLFDNAVIAALFTLT